MREVFIVVGVLLFFLWGVVLFRLIVRLRRVLGEDQFEVLGFLYLPLRVTMLCAMLLWAVTAAVIDGQWWFYDVPTPRVGIAAAVMVHGLFKPIALGTLCFVVGTRVSSAVRNGRDLISLSSATNTPRISGSSWQPSSRAADPFRLPFTPDGGLLGSAPSSAMATPQANAANGACAAGPNGAPLWADWTSFRAWQVAQANNAEAAHEHRQRFSPREGDASDDAVAVAPERLGSRLSSAVGFGAGADGTGLQASGNAHSFPQPQYGDGRRSASPLPPQRHGSAATFRCPPSDLAELASAATRPATPTHSATEPGSTLPPGSARGSAAGGSQRGGHGSKARPPSCDPAADQAATAAAALGATGGDGDAATGSEARRRGASSSQRYAAPPADGGGTHDADPSLHDGRVGTAAVNGGGGSGVGSGGVGDAAEATETSVSLEMLPTIGSLRATNSLAAGASSQTVSWFVPARRRLLFVLSRPCIAVVTVAFAVFVGLAAASSATDDESQRVTGRVADDCTNTTIERPSRVAPCVASYGGREAFVLPVGIDVVASLLSGGFAVAWGVFGWRHYRSVLHTSTRRAFLFSYAALLSLLVLSSVGRMMCALPPLRHGVAYAILTAVLQAFDMALLTVVTRRFQAG